MKHISKIVGLAFAGLFFTSCSKDEIRVIKNLDTSWEVDKSIKDADFRNRLGFDPRYNYILTQQTDFSFPMVSLGTIALAGRNEANIEVKLLEPLDKDIEVTLSYEPSLFEQVKGKSEYTGYVVGREDLLQIPQKTVTIVKGQTTASFSIAIDNNSNFKEKVVIPFTFKTTDKDIKLFENHDRVLVKIYNEEVKFTYPTKIVKKVGLGNDLYSSDILFSVESSRNLNTVLFELRRAGDEGIASPAPQGVEGQLSDPIPMLSNEANFLVSLNKDLLTDGSTHTLPLQVVAIQGGETYPLPDLIEVSISGVNQPIDQNINKGVKELGDFIEVNRYASRTVTGTYYQQQTGRDNFFTDEQEDYLSNTSVIRVEFIQPAILTSVKTSFFWNYQGLESFEVFAINEQNEEVSMGVVRPNGTQGDFALIFKIPVKVKGLILKNFTGTGWWGLGGLQIYEN